MIGTKLGPYDILAKIGQGGMGEVYRATDTRLDRAVALKVLPADVASHPDRLDRFRREAKVLAALDHPNIVTVFSVEEVGAPAGSGERAIHFLTMQLVEGQSLEEMIPPGGLPLERVLQIAPALADALAAAHDKGIVHRDLKPANVMIAADGRVKVLDFGLAKEIGASGPADATRASDGHTQQGVVMGTPAYMSPEQLAGRGVDHRTDLFSLGVVLYQMVSGRRPFDGASSIELASSILRDTPVPVSDVRADMPAGLARLVHRCLEKDARQRIQSAREVADECRDLARHVSSGVKETSSARASSADGLRTTAADEGFWILVRPFKTSGTNADLVELAEGLADEIVTGLSRFSYLRVVARTGAPEEREDLGLRASRETAAARYVIDGTLRQAGTRLRLAAQLVDRTTGAHLWAENYERPFTSDALFDLQDDLVPRIVSTVADVHGVLPRSMCAAVRGRPPEQLSPYEAVLRSFAYFERVNAEELAAARAGLEIAVQKAPDLADAWAMLALLCVQDYGQGFKVIADSLARGSAAARRAVEVGPSNHLAFFSLAQSLFFERDLGSFRQAAERAAALNPMDGNSIAFLGELLVYAGDTERGLTLSDRAKQLNPHHPWWYWYANFFAAYGQGDYRGALAHVLKFSTANHWGAQSATLATCGQLGEHHTGDRALRTLLSLRPDFASRVRADMAKWWDPAAVEHFIDGLRKGGLDVPAASTPQPPARTPSAASAPDSGSARADEGFWVAVLPFKCGSANSGVAALADGLSEALVSGLSLFSYLRVIARSATDRYAREPADARTVGQQLGARYVIEGTLRQAGSQVRVAVQLIDATTGAQLWGETYDRAFSGDAVFALQDELVPRIVSTVADAYGVLPHSMSQAVRSKPLGELTPYEALLRSLSYAERVTPEEHGQAKAAVERALEQSPSHSDCWAMLSIMLADEYGHGFGASRETLDGALRAARRAVDSNPSNHRAYQALAWALFLRKEFPACRQAGERALALNPMDACTAVYVGQTLAYSGDWQRGCSLIAHAIELNPHHPGWYWYASFLDAYRQRDYDQALAIALKMNLPGVSLVDVALAASYGQLGDRQGAQNSLRDLLALKPEYAGVARQQLAKWFDAEIVEHLIDGLHKAGLEIVAPAKAADATIAIAVLPFADMSPAQDQQYLCEGMAEEIMNALVPIRGIRVASRTSAFRARHDYRDLPAIAQALSVNHILEGSVRTAGSRLRVTAQLTDVASGYQTWSNRFDRDAADVFAIQDEIAAGVVDAVKTHLAPGEHAAHSRAKTGNLEAYRSYLKGRHLRGIEDHAGAYQAFDEAVRLDPSHAPSWTGLAEITVLSAVFSIFPAREACRNARRALETARSLQGESADGWHVEAFACWIERRWDEMEAAWRRALEIEPRHVLALGSFGAVLCTRQRFEEAVPILDRARDADPLASFPYALSGCGYLNCGRLREAERHLDDALSFEKDDVTALYCQAVTKVALGQVEDGIALAERAVTLSHRGGVLVGILGWALASAGRTSEARALLDELRARPAGSPTVVAEAWLLGAIGDIDGAFDVLARAEEEYQANLYFTGLPVFDALRGDPRFAALLARLGLPAATRAI